MVRTELYESTALHIKETQWEELIQAPYWRCSAGTCPHLGDNSASSSAPKFANTSYDVEYYTLGHCARTVLALRKNGESRVYI